MGAGQGHGGDRLSLSLSLREKMYGYGCQYAIARLGETPRGVRLPTRRGGVGHPIRACAALRLPSLVWNNGGLDKLGTGFVGLAE